MKTLKRIEIVEVPERRGYKVKDAAKYIGISKNALRKYTDLEQLKAKRLPNGHRLYLKEDLDHFIASLPAAVDAA